MKIRHLIITGGIALLCVGAILAFTGCTTKTTVTESADGTFKTNTLSSLNLPALTNAIALAVPPAVNLAVSQEPQARPYLADAAVAINLLLASGTYDPNSLNAALNTLGVKEVRTPQAQAAINVAVALYKGMYGQVVEAQLDKVTWLPPILKAIADGITEGLARPPMPPITYLSPEMQKIVERDRAKFLGIYLGMIAETDGKDGVMMFSATSGECLKYISHQDFVDIFVNKTKPEYGN